VSRARVPGHGELRCAGTEAPGVRRCLTHRSHSMDTAPQQAAGAITLSTEGPLGVLESSRTAEPRTLAACRACSWRSRTPGPSAAQKRRPAQGERPAVPEGLRHPWAAGNCLHHQQIFNAREPYSDTADVMILTIGNGGAFERQFAACEVDVDPGSRVPPAQTEGRSEGVQPLNARRRRAQRSRTTWTCASRSGSGPKTWREAISAASCFSLVSIEVRVSSLASASRTSSHRLK